MHPLCIACINQASYSWLEHIEKLASAIREVLFTPKVPEWVSKMI